MSKIEIHTRKWRGDQSVTDQMIEDGVDANVTLQCRVYIDGHEIAGVIMARPLYTVNDFTTVTLRVAGEVEIVNHTRESWEALA